MRYRIVLAGLLLASLVTCDVAFAQNDSSLTLDEAIELAIGNDDWLVANELDERAYLEQSIAAGQLPDPLINIGMNNLPVDSFSFSQEPMTQFRIGVNQFFPRGDTLRILQDISVLRSEVNPHLRDDREAAVTLEVSNLWLSTYFAEQAILLINNDRELFEQLVDITSARYTTAAGLARQQDLVRAEVELVRLDDRLAMLRQQQDSNKQRLVEWLPYDSLSLPLDSVLPFLEVPNTELQSLAQASEFFLEHPIVRAHDKKIEIAQEQVELSRQAFKPSFSVGAGYGYRDDAQTGFNTERADFLTLSLNFDLPLFTENRQKPRLRASQYRASATQTERILLIKDLFANYQQALAQLDVLDERAAIFNDTLLGQLADLAEATLASYTADEGDFEEVMRAYISELNAKIELLQIDVERLKVISLLNYLLSTSEL